MQDFYRQQAERTFTGGPQGEVASQAQYNPNGAGSILGANLKKPERDLQHIITRINECIGNAGASRDRVREISDRVKGVVPEVAGNSNLASGGPGSISEINSLLVTLTNVLGDLGANISRIESL